MLVASLNPETNVSPASYTSRAYSLVSPNLNVHFARVDFDRLVIAGSMKQARICALG